MSRWKRTFGRRLTFPLSRFPTCIALHVHALTNHRERHGLLRVHRQRLGAADHVLRIRIALGDLVGDGNEVLVFEAADGLGGGLGEFEEFLQRHLAALFEVVENLLLALGELRGLAGRREETDEEAFAPAVLLAANDLGQHALQGGLRRAAVVVRDPARELEHAGRDEGLLADDAGEVTEVRVRGLLGECRDAAHDLPVAEGHLHARADLHPPSQLRRDGVVELPAKGDLKGDAGDHERVESWGVES